MKKLIFALLIFNYSFSQDQFKLTPEGFTDYVVTSIEVTQSELYEKSLNWVKETYKNPDEVIKMTIENEKLRFEGFQSDFHCFKSMGVSACSNIIYTIEITFKDGRYKFDPIAVEFSNSSGNKAEIKLNEMGSIYFKNGKPMKRYDDFILNFQGLFNKLNQDLKEYLDGKKTKEDW